MVRDQRSWNRVTILLVAICVAIGTVQTEILKDPTHCSRTKCKVPASRKFKYEEGIFYWYRYSVDVSTNIGGPPGQARNESTLRLDADLVVRFTSPCEGTLKFRNASISHDPEKYNPEFPDRAGGEFKQGLERHVLRFAYDDGRIDELCPDRQEPLWALNLKRGVLSMLQNTMHRFDVDRRVNELDVNGVCETLYRLHEAKRTSLVVKKTKNLSDCAYGSKHFSVIQSNYYRSPRSGSRAAQHPLFESHSDCELTIDHNVYQQVVCKDLHQLQPFSTDSTGARTESTAVLRLINEAKEDEDEYEMNNDDDDDDEDEEENEKQSEHEWDLRAKRTTLIYDYSRSPKTIHGELRTSRNLLKTMCRLGVNMDEFQQRFPEMFTRFVHSARLLDYLSLSQLFIRANYICSTGKKHIMDALPFMGSNAAVNVMKNLIIKKSVDQATLDNWVMAFALIPRPNLETIKVLSPLLEFQRQIPNAQFVLSYSATIHAFCSTHEARCSNVEQVTRFLTYLEQKVVKGCAPRVHSPSTVKDTIEALKAIGNMGLETENILTRLKECIDDQSGFLPMEVRVAAVDAHRRMPSCEKTRDLFFLNYYRNFTLDTEIRIASYLQVMRCPDYNVVKTIKHTLKVEEVNQVGTFVWSHLTNLYNSASPTMVEIQSLLTDRDLNDKFNSDRRKFSRNYDGSFFSEEYNFGANYRGNLIFSPRSYIPRSATFNLTFDLFGKSVNALELTTRFEGLEYYAEKFFGPDGPYSNEKVSGFFMNFLRRFRSAPEEDYWKRVKRLPNVIDNNFDNPRISFGYKFFGNDLKYYVLNNDREIREALVRLDPWEKFKQIASGKEIHYENAVMFLDSTYVVPMSSGLPVRLDFAGSAACNFKMSGLLKTKRIIFDGIELVSNLAPSVSVDVVGSMTVDAFYKSAGIKLRSNVYTSGAVQIHLDVKGMRSIRLSLGLPNKKMDVFSIGTDILLTKSNGAELEEKPLGVLIVDQDDRNSKQMIVRDNIISNTSCSWSALDRLVGLKLCVDYQLSNTTKNPDAPYLILSGPTLFKISLIKADPTAKNYLLEYKWEKTEKQNLFRVAFDTPGSQVNRELSASMSFDTKTNNVTVVLRSARNSIVAEGTYKSTENETFIDIGFDINGTKHLDASLGYSIKRFAYGYTFSPQVHLIVNNERIAALSGTIRNARKNNVFQCDVDLTFRTKKVWSKLVGYIVQRNVSLAADIQLEYQLQKMPKKETLQLEVSLSNRSSKTLTYKAADLKLHSTAYSQLNAVITAWYQQALGHLELHLEFNSKPHLMDERHTLTAQLILSYSKMYFQNQDTKVSASIAVTKPIQDLDIKISVQHYAMGPESRTSLLIGYAPGKKISLTVILMIPRGLMFTMEGHANLTIPNFNSMLLSARITEHAKNTYALNFSGTWFSGHNVTIGGTYSDQSVATVVSHNLKLNLKSPSFANDVLLYCKLYKNYSDVMVDLYVEQLDHDKYAFILNHTVASSTDFVTYIEGRYKSNVYSMMTNVDTEREIRMEVHLDKWRDVHLALTGVNEENRKEFGAEVKWDANRDPALKLELFLAFEKTVPVLDEKHPPEKNLTVTVILTYPGCFVSTSCRVVSRGQFNYIVDATTKWNLDQAIKLFIETDYVAKPGMRRAMLESQLLTPFETWKRTALNTRYLQGDNRILLSGSAQWKDSQHVFTEFDGSTEVRDKFKEWKATCVVTSSVHSMFWTTVNVTHKIVDSEVADTHLLVKYNPDKTIEAWSIWYLDKGSEDVFNVTGNLHLELPVTSYKKSDMRCQLQILPDWKFLGAASLDLDKETYTAKLLGDLKRIKESTVQFNVTTPLEKFAYVRGHFGLSESNRHVVAMVVIPSGPLGFEGLCHFFTANYDFNIKLMLGTPLELLQKLLFVAKLNNQEADFRIAYNNMLTGFHGVWHYSTITDFHYTYLLFTPVRGLEEIGAVAKLIVTDIEAHKQSIDTEFSIRLADVKIGVNAKTGLKPPPVNIQIKAPLEIASNSTTQEEEDFGEDEKDNSLYWHGEIEVYPAIMEPVLGDLDIDSDGSFHKIYAVVQYFQGKIIVDNMFFMEDLFNIRNELNVIAPFKIFNELVCLNVFFIDLENVNCTMQIAVNVRRNKTWSETGMKVNYLYREDEINAQSHNVALNVKTSLEFLKFLNTSIELVRDIDLYRVAVAIYAPNSAIETLVRLKTPKDLVNATVAMRIDTPMLRLPEWTLLVAQDFRGDEKHLAISGRLRSRSKSASLETKWYAVKNRVRATVALKTWIEPLKNLEADVSYTNAIATNDTANLIIQVKHQDRHRYKLTGNYSVGTVLAELYTPTVNGPHFEFHGVTKKINDTGYHVNGELLDLATKARREVFATIVGLNDTSLAVEMTTKSKSGTDVEDFDLRLKKWSHGVNARLVGRSLNGTLDANFINYFNWDLRTRADTLQMSGERKQLFKVNGTMNVQVNGYTTLYVHAETLIKGLENLVLNGNMLLTNNSGEIRVQDQVNEDSHRMTVQWKLLHMLDMMGRTVIGYDTKDLGAKDVDVRLFYMNPGRTFKNIAVGFDVDIDREKWKFAANATGGIQDPTLNGLFVVRLPPPNNDDHRFLINFYRIDGFKDVSYVIGYNALRAMSNYASDGSIHMDKPDINGHLRVSWGSLPVQSINNLFNITFENKDFGLKYSLYTPKFKQQETLIVLFNYDAAHDTNIRLIGANVYFPASTKIGSANVSYDSLANVNGTATVSTVSQIECQFIVLTTLQRNKRYLKVSWPKNITILDSDYTYRSHKLDSDLKGVFHVEVPLNTRHVGHLTYGYEKRPQVTTGTSEVTYNGEKVLQGRYNSKSESRAGFEKDRIQITIENPFKPLGILYINQYEYSAGNEGTNYPTVEFKHVNLYRIDNRTAFNVTGESKIRTTHTGQDIHLKAIHFNRTVELRTDYQILPGEFDQNASLSLSKDVWMSYRVNILNKTTEDVDNQFLVLSVSYPRRNITLDGFYWISREELSSELKLDWDRETENPRTIGAQFNWANVSSADIIMQQRATFSLRHPSFAKTISLQGELLKRDSQDLLNVTIVADYSIDPNKLFVFSGFVRDESNLPASRRYVYQVIGKHPNTKLDLDVRGFVHKHELVLFETMNSGSYRRTFLTSETGQLNSRLDLNRREVLFQRDYNEAVKYLYARYYSTEKQYIVNGSIVNTPDLNATGDFFLDPDEKLTRMMLNYTPDAVESLRMYGTIPDARNAVFDIWRTYEEDFSISDVSFYLKLNHSRLVTSTLRWRPELKSDIINGIKQTALDIYNGMNDDADYWRQYVKTETVNVISDVWDDAQEDLREFIDDWNNLKDLQTDLDELKTYLNNSYNANDFYIKDFVDIGMYVIDELALRTHIQSLPNIFNEIWEIMGESGQAIRNSLLWVIETIKNAFNKVSEIVSAILRGDSVAQVANIIEKLIEKYDKFMKDLHVSFIKYIENLCVKISQSIFQQWNRFLLMIEPLFIRFIHYLETVAWKASKEVVDFLYDRGNDLIASPYFDRFTKFTQDIDKLYRDIKANDIVTNVQKYAGLIIQFLKERYFTFVPFSKELKDVVDEIIAELKELQKLPSIHYAIENMQQLYDKVYYVYNYLGVRAKLESIVRLIHVKLMDISQTALQAESRYREAKTKFIFDPNQGLMCLEQKLPMSWHAFNQTPEFQEIPEFRAISDIKSYFVASNLTFWSLYRYKSYMEPQKWLPPFNAQAMIIGSQHFITFDGRHLNFVGPCTYLLARDFVRNTFTILIKYDLRSDRVTHKIVILIGKDAIELDIFNDNIKIVSERSPSTTSNLQLPIELENGTTYVYRAENVVTVERKQDQLRLECNLKFSLCTLELSGWYHGKTAGILGTMNNEPMDDTTASDGFATTDVARFAGSWSIDASDECPRDTNLASSKEEKDEALARFCDDLFVNKSSEFLCCFDIVDPTEYSTMCSRSASKSEACTVALSYMQVCMFHDTYLRIPDMCTSCTMMNGDRMAEGQFRRLEGKNVPMSTDVVFIVEGKDCNRDVRQNRSIEQLIVQLAKEFEDRGLADNRWSLVVFGANGVFERPRSVVFDGQIFTKNAARFVDYFDHVPVGDGSRDIFAAIVFATKLVFRAGVSKTFVLMPCSRCEPENQMLDYSVLHEALLEHDITLHILMDGDFEFEKEKMSKMFYGLDAINSYTRRDVKTLIGDVELRRHVKLSKSALGYCTPLSLEINGTIFSGDKLRFDKLISIKKFISVFAKRVALTAVPNPCQNCECTANNNGVTRMECIPCVYPMPVTVDYDAFNLNDSLTALQRVNVDYGQIDIDYS